MSCYRKTFSAYFLSRPVGSNLKRSNVFRDVQDGACLNEGEEDSPGATTVAIVEWKGGGFTWGTGTVVGIAAGWTPTGRLRATCARRTCSASADRTISRLNTVNTHATLYEFLLPGHKADRYFEGNKIIIPAHRFTHHPLRHFHTFFLNRLRLFFNSDVAGQSMRAGGGHGK
jgi:hypothetical protein